MTEITSVFNEFAFPAAVCIVMMLYIYYKDKAHSEESKNFTEALNKNTLVVSEFKEMMTTLINLLKTK